MDVVVCVPKNLWRQWCREGALPGERAPSDTEYHYHVRSVPRPNIEPGERVYIFAYGQVRGYAPLARYEQFCTCTGRVTACLVRRDHAVALTVPNVTNAQPRIRGFQNWRYRWWSYAEETPAPHWATADVPPAQQP